MDGTFLAFLDTNGPLFFWLGRDNFMLNVKEDRGHLIKNFFIYIFIQDFLAFTPRLGIKNYREKWKFQTYDWEKNKWYTEFLHALYTRVARDTSIRSIFAYSIKHGLPKKRIVALDKSISRDFLVRSFFLYNVFGHQILQYNHFNGMIILIMWM